MTERSRPQKSPPGLRTSTDLDGLHVELSAHHPYLTSRQGRLLNMVVLSAIVLGGLWIVLLTDSWLVPVSLMGAYMVWVAVGDLGPPRSASQHLVFGQHRFRGLGEPVQFDVPWTDVGRVRVEDGLSPTLHLNVHASEPLRIPMQNEPPEHAEWLRVSIESHARGARERSGALNEVPESLRPLRRTE